MSLLNLKIPKRREMMKKETIMEFLIVVRKMRKIKIKTCNPKSICLYGKPIGCSSLKINFKGWKWVSKSNSRESTDSKTSCTGKGRKLTQNWKLSFFVRCWIKQKRMPLRLNWSRLVLLLPRKSENLQMNQFSKNISKARWLKLDYFQMRVKFSARIWS